MSDKAISRISNVIEAVTDIFAIGMFLVAGAVVTSVLTGAA